MSILNYSLGEGEKLFIIAIVDLVRDLIANNIGLEFGIARRIWIYFQYWINNLMIYNFPFDIKSVCLPLEKIT